jgi:hypothetical protein
MIAVFATLLTMTTAQTPSPFAPPPRTPPAQPGGVPTLRYDPPANFYRSASTPPEQYSSNEVNANLQIYSFRPFSGDVVQAFERTLLREWIDPQYQEGPVPAQPLYFRQVMPGAQAVVTARFLQNIAGVSTERMRVLIVAGGYAAIVDLYANSPYSWQRAGPAMQAMLGSMRVETGAAPPPPLSGPAATAARGFAGVYMGLKGHYVVDLMGAVGSGHWLTQPHFYLFSVDGRVYRTFNPPEQGLTRFDFDAAQRSDPESSGRYSVQGDRLIIQMGGPQPETFTLAVPRSTSLVIDRVTYTRQ